MTNKDEIKELFSESFKGFEKEVDPGLWNKIQSNLGGSGAGNTGQAASAGKAGLLKTVLIGSISVAAITGGIYLYNSNETEGVVPKELTETSTTIENEGKKELLVDDKNNYTQIIEKINGSTDPVIIKHREEIKKELIKDLEASDIINKEEQVFNNTDILDLLDKDLLDKLVDSKTAETQQNSKGGSQEVSISESSENTEIPGALIAFADYKVREVSGGFSVAFTTISKEGENYNWDFGNGETSSVKNPTTIYNNKGNYNVKLLVSASDGRVVEQKYLVKAFVKSFLEVPNVLTPNNDGMNDYLIVRARGIKEFGLTVVSLNGKVLYETSDAKFKWNGKDLSGNTLKSGTYIIIVAAIGEDGQEYVQSSELWIEK